MIRSLYSGVSGMKAHQARMDVIGNNIANVNTYGFKAGRASFSDVYYQTISAATGATSTSGGTNPSQIGYGVQLGSVDVLQTRATFSMTDNAMDLAIAGEGFFQVQDSDGNTYFTRAGQLSIDASGNLVDSNGNYVLGISGDPLGKSPSASKIQLAVPNVPAAVSAAAETINGVDYTITSSRQTSEGNVTFFFESDPTLPGGQPAAASITSAGITIKLNASHRFSDLAELNGAINDAITEANGGVEHPAGVFTIATEPGNVFPGLEAASGTISSTFLNQEGTVSFPSGITSVFGGMTLVENGAVGQFTPGGNLTFSAVHHDAAAPDPENWTITAANGSKTYTGIITDLTSGIVRLADTAAGSLEYIEMTHPGLTVMNAANTAEAFTDVADCPAADSDYFLGGISLIGVSSDFESAGTAENTDFSAEYSAYSAGPPATAAGWKITAVVGGNTFTGIVSESTGSTLGTIELISNTGEAIEILHPGFDTMCQNAGIATPVAAGTDLPLTLTPFTVTATASTPFVGTGLTGAEIVSTDYSTILGSITGLPDGGLFGGIGFKAVSADFDSEGAVTFNNAVYEAEVTAGEEKHGEGWKISMVIDGTTYTGYVTKEMTSTGSFLMKSQDGSYVLMNHPGLAAVNLAAGIPSGSQPVVGDTMTAPVGAFEATASKASVSLGLGSTSVKLEGGTEGGNQTVADLSSISIGSDGTIEAIHSIHGRIQLGQIILASFENPQGLEQSGNTYFVESANSGAAQLAIPGSSGSGSLASGSLEMSNVDLSKEFADMITTQRGFQANSRMITVSDTMLEELINLKR